LRGGEEKGGVKKGERDFVKRKVSSSLEGKGVHEEEV